MSKTSAMNMPDVPQGQLPEHLELQRTRIFCKADAPIHTDGVEYSGAYAAMGFDNSLQLERFCRDFEVEIKKLTEDVIEFDMIGIDASLANAFRRILIAEVPTMAIEKVLIVNNTSVMADEILSHRLGLLPIDADPRLFDFLSENDTPNERNTIVFKLNVHCKKDGPRLTVRSDQLHWLPNGSDLLKESHDLSSKPRSFTSFSCSQASLPHFSGKPIGMKHDDIIINQLGPGQSIELEAHAVKGTGKVHAKWSPVGTAWYRMLPEVILLKEVNGNDAEKLVKKCPVGVFDIEDVGCGTPLWRNGPPEKPILCNACGSRWRIKGSLANYTPLHARESINWEEPKVAKAKSSITPQWEKLQKRKRINGVVENECEIPFTESNEIHIKNLNEDACNRSSSGSVITYSESSVHFHNTDANDWTGPAQSNVPLKKRSVNCPKPSLFEKLTRDLYSIWHDQQSADTSEISDADLVFEGENPMGSVEIGHGGILLRYPCSETVEESEASTLHMEEYIVSDAHSRPASFLVNSEIRSRNLSSAGIDKLNSTAYMVKGHTIRDGSPENLNVLQDRDSLIWSDELEGKIHKVVDGGNRAGRDFCQHFSLTPTDGPYKSQYQPLVGFADNERSFFSTSPPDNSFMPQSVDESSNPEFLLDASCNASFQDAEILNNNPWFHNTASSSSQTE